MTIEEQGGLSWGTKPVATDHRVPLGRLGEVDVLHARFAQQVTRQPGGFLGVGSVAREGADAGDPQQFEERIDGLLLLSRGVLECATHADLLSCLGSIAPWR